MVCHRDLKRKEINVKHRKRGREREGGAEREVLKTRILAAMGRERNSSRKPTTYHLVAN